MEQPDEKPQVHEGQLSFEVPESPAAIGKWTPEEQFKAYAAMFGSGAAERQKRLLEEANQCTCGVEAAEKHKARQEDRKPRSLKGHHHKASCPKVRAQPEMRGLSEEAIRQLYDEALRRAAA